MPTLAGMKDRLAEDAVQIWRKNKRMTPLEAAREAIRIDEDACKDPEYWVLKVIDDVAAGIDAYRRLLWINKKPRKSGLHIH
ncbi:MAG TPA: hypothetical protein VJH69_01375 [Candidatus Paceibacterota bacterium]